MSIPSLKRLLWVMNEILAASSFGITRNEISDKWANSIKNDQNETEISERTFHRIKNDFFRPNIDSKAADTDNIINTVYFPVKSDLDG